MQEIDPACTASFYVIEYAGLFDGGVLSPFVESDGGILGPYRGMFGEMTLLPDGGGFARSGPCIADPPSVFPIFNQTTVGEYVPGVTFDAVRARVLNVTSGDPIGPGYFIEDGGYTASIVYSVDVPLNAPPCYWPAAPPRASATLRP